jgi:hypothetical protein
VDVCYGIGALIVRVVMVKHFDDIFLNVCPVYRLISACMEVEDVMDKLKDSKLLDASVILAID